MFVIGDRVRQRYFVSYCENEKDHNPNGVVVSVSGRWITVKHDTGKALTNKLAGPRFDYLSEELEHINPVLRLADSL